MREEHKKMIHVEGHRGARWVRPENTLPAFEYALSVGVDVLEMDLAVTADHKVVVSHYPHISPELFSRRNGRSFSVGLLIKDLTLKQAKEFECGMQPNPSFPGQIGIVSEIPTLEEVFEMVNLSAFSAAKEVWFNIETKVYADHPEYTTDVNTFVNEMLEVFEKYPHFHNRIIVQSFDFRTLRRVRELDSSFKLAALTDERMDPLKTLGDLKVEILSPNYEMIDRKIVETAQANGMQVVPWTVNTPHDWEKMIEYGVDGIISDNPAALLKFLREKGYHS